MFQRPIHSRRQLTRTKPTAMQLEPRFMFDGAAIDTALDVFPAQDVLERPAVAPEAQPIFQLDPSLSDLSAVSLQAQEQVKQYLAQASDQTLFELFNGGRSEPDAQWAERLASLKSALADGSLKLNVLQMDSSSQFTAVAAFTQEGPNGEPAIFINRFWFEMFDAPDALSLIHI